MSFMKLAFGLADRREFAVVHQDDGAKPAIIYNVARTCLAAAFLLHLISAPLHAQTTSTAPATPNKDKQSDSVTNQAELDAQRKLGEGLITGRKIKQDKAQGLKLLETAIDKGDRESLIVLGRLLMDGQYLERDRPRALALFQRAAKLGDFQGIEYAGVMLMWNGVTADDKREAERLLTMAGTAGRGYAWTTLAYGVIYKKLPGTAYPNYKTYVDNARKLGETKIEIVEAERLLYGLGVKYSAPRAIAHLEKAAASGNPEAIKFLIKLHRDGAWNVKKSIPKARDYLKSYGSKLTPDMQQQQKFLLQVATTQKLPEFADLSRTARASSDFNSIEFQKQMFQANQNFSIYLAQEALKQKKQYEGPLNGRATKRTVEALQNVCSNLAWKGGCDKKLVSDGAMAVIILN